MDINTIIKKFELVPHFEGGYYKRVWESDYFLNNTSQRLASQIYYLLNFNQVSKLHSLESDEIWTHLSGEPVRLHLFNLIDKRYETIILNKETLDFHYVIKAGTIFGAELSTESGFSLISCSVIPEFIKEKFSFANKDELLSNFPMHSEIINKLI